MEQLGFSHSVRDPLYEKFIEKLFSRPEYQNIDVSQEQLPDMSALMDEIMREILEEEKK